MTARAAVVLMAYGSPERLADVPAYYADIRGGRPIRPELLDDLVERYRRLGIDEGSPLNAITEQTRAALERELAGLDTGDSSAERKADEGDGSAAAARADAAAARDAAAAAREAADGSATGDAEARTRTPAVPVFTGMKHWTPRIAEAAESALATGARTVVGFVLAPHYSRLSIGGYKQQLEDSIAGRAHLAFVDSWHDDSDFIALLADRIRGTDAHVVFTAHSLPARILAEGDPYKDQLLETSHLVAEQARIPPDRWTFSFQSESATGEPWLGPDILDHLAELHERGVRDVLVCPVGFVADHLEIRWDLDHEATDKARELGMNFARIEMPNADPVFVRVLAKLVRQALRVPSEA